MRTEPSLMTRRFILENHAYHTISVTRKREPLMANDAAARCVVDAIAWESVAEHAYILAYAILPDHLHLLFVPRPPMDVSTVMHNLKSFSAKAINRALARSGPVWQQSFYDRVIRDDTQLLTTIDYIHHNPVAARLATEAKDYRWCSAHPAALTDVERFLANDAEVWAPRLRGADSAG
jgi:REP-associated tyrosine transposase